MSRSKTGLWAIACSFLRPSARDVKPAKTASEHLWRLVAAGFLRQVGERRGAKYLVGPSVEGWDYGALVDDWVTEGSHAVLEKVLNVEPADVVEE